MRFDLIRPCADCPFRRDRLFPLHPERVREIGAAEGFHCHKTTEQTDDGPQIHERSQMCAGWALVHRHQGTTFNKLLPRLGHLAGWSPEQLREDVPVWGSFEEYADRLWRAGQ